MAAGVSEDMRKRHAHGAHKEKSELPLILFTLCAAASVGVAACALATFAADLMMQGGFAPARAAYALRSGGPLLQTSAIQPVLAMAASALATIGMLASIAHLAKPLRAPNALRNLASSWLSREILAVSAYWFICLAWFAACFVLEALAFACCAAALVSGAFVLVSAAKAYRIHGQPLWNGPETSIELYAAACGAGVPLACLLAFMALRYTPMPLAAGTDMALEPIPAYDPSMDAASSAAPVSDGVAAAMPLVEEPDAFVLALSPYLMNDVLLILLVTALAFALILYWKTGGLRGRRMASIESPTPREELAVQRLAELEGPRELVIGLTALALLAGALAAFAWFIAGYVEVRLIALSTALGFAAFFLARARFYRMSVISRHALRRKLR